VERHREVIEAFRQAGPVLAFTTQVAEMSLDLSADLLVTQLATIAALIQRLGRLNRRATADDPWPFIVYGLEFDARSTAPYEADELNEAKAWLELLGMDGLSQRALATAWKPRPESSGKPVSCAWLDGGYETRARPLRQGSPGIEIILPEDVDAVRSGGKPEEFRIPMILPKDRAWHLPGTSGMRWLSARCLRAAMWTTIR
jgi:CRISPR-associated endonuclease/helicase Cas3